MASFLASVVLLLATLLGTSLIVPALLELRAETLRRAHDR